MDKAVAVAFRFGIFGVLAVGAVLVADYFINRRERGHGQPSGRRRTDEPFLVNVIMIRTIHLSYIPTLLLFNLF